MNSLKKILNSHRYFIILPALLVTLIQLGLLSQSLDRYQKDFVINFSPFFAEEVRDLAKIYDSKSIQQSILSVNFRNDLQVAIESLSGQQIKIKVFSRHRDALETLNLSQSSLNSYFDQKIDEKKSDCSRYLNFILENINFYSQKTMTDGDLKNFVSVLRGRKICSPFKIIDPNNDTLIFIDPNFKVFISLIEERIKNDLRTISEIKSKDLYSVTEGVVIIQKPEVNQVLIIISTFFVILTFSFYIERLFRND